MALAGSSHVMTLQKSQVYEFDYVNHRGELGRRRVIFHDVQLGIVHPYYPTPTWLLNCYDLDRRQYRSFDISKIQKLSYDGRPATFPEKENP